MAKDKKRVALYNLLIATLDLRSYADRELTPTLLNPLRIEAEEKARVCPEWQPAVDLLPRDFTGSSADDTRQAFAEATAKLKEIEKKYHQTQKGGKKKMATKKMPLWLKITLPVAACVAFVGVLVGAIIPGIQADTENRVLLAYRDNLPQAVAADTATDQLNLNVSNDTGAQLGNQNDTTLQNVAYQEPAAADMPSADTVTRQAATDTSPQWEDNSSNWPDGSEPVKVEGAIKLQTVAPLGDAHHPDDQVAPEDARLIIPADGRWHIVDYYKEQDLAVTLVVEPTQVERFIPGYGSVWSFSGNEVSTVAQAYRYAEERTEDWFAGHTGEVYIVRCADYSRSNLDIDGRVYSTTYSGFQLSADGVALSDFIQAFWEPIQANH